MENIICPYCGEISKESSKKCFECNSNLLLNERYYLLDVLGENSGITYLAKDIETGQKVIIKELEVKNIERWKTEELFLREGKVLKSLNHKNIPKFLDQFTIEIDRDITHYIVMEYIQGVSLSKLMDKKRYREEEILNILKNILETLNYLHNLHPSIIHRDIKPSNLILKEDDSIAIIDFGGVKDIIKPFMGSTVAGTFGYTAPEQLMGKAEKRSDYYSVGMTIVSLLIGETPEKYIEKGIYYLKNNLNLSDKMLTIIKKLTDQDKNKRYKNITQILKDIKRDKNQFKRKKEVVKRNSNGKSVNHIPIDKIIYDYQKLEALHKKISNLEGTYSPEGKKEEIIAGFAIIFIILMGFTLIIKSVIYLIAVAIITALVVIFTIFSYIKRDFKLDKEETFLVDSTKITDNYELIYLFHQNNFKIKKNKNSKFDEIFLYEKIDKRKVERYNQILIDNDVKILYQ